MSAFPDSAAPSPSRPPFPASESSTSANDTVSGTFAGSTPRVVCRLLPMGVVAGLLLLSGCGEPSETPPEPEAWQLAPRLEPQESGTDALLIGMSIVDDSTVWLSGTGGSWLRTLDGGVSWEVGVVEGAEELQFRDVHALDAANAWLLSIGDGEDSRIYRTKDGGSNWALQFRNEEPRGFFDCFGFWDERSGIAFSDSFDGRFLVIETRDGETWAPISPERLPEANPGEGSFAASGTCVATWGDSLAWIGTGAGEGGSRVLRTTDRGRNWSVYETPIVQGSMAGIASIRFRDAGHGVALGGDIAEPDSITQNVAFTVDGGETWWPGEPTPFAGAVYGSSWVPGAPSPTLVATGPNGVAYTIDSGSSWVLLDPTNHWSVGFHAPDRGWATGPGGRITRIRLFLPGPEEG